MHNSATYSTKQSPASTGMDVPNASIFVVQWADLTRIISAALKDYI